MFSKKNKKGIAKLKIARYSLPRPKKYGCVAQLARATDS